MGSHTVLLLYKCMYNKQNNTYNIIQYYCFCDFLFYCKCHTTHDKAKNHNTDSKIQVVDN